MLVIGYVDSGVEVDSVTAYIETEALSGEFIATNFFDLYVDNSKTQAVGVEFRFVTITVQFLCTGNLVNNLH